MPKHRHKHHFNARSVIRSVEKTIGAARRDAKLTLLAGIDVIRRNRLGFGLLVVALSSFFFVISLMSDQPMGTTSALGSTAVLVVLASAWALVLTRVFNGESPRQLWVRIRNENDA